MTEICSKSDAKFTDGLAGLSNKKGSEDGIGLFDSLFGIISEETIKLEPEITLLPSDLNLPDQINLGVDLGASLLPNINRISGMYSNPIATNTIDGPNRIAQSTSNGLNIIELTLKNENIGKHENTENHFLNKLAAALTKPTIKVSDLTKGHIVNKTEVDSVQISSQAIKESKTIFNQNIGNELIEKTYESKRNLITINNPFPGKNDQEMLNIQIKKTAENNSKTLLQMPKLVGSTSEKEFLKFDTVQNATITQSSPTSLSSGNTNSGGNMNSGGFSHSNSTTVLEHLNMLDKSWGKNLLNRVQTALKNGNETIELALRPKNLGKIKISLILHQEGAKISIVTETASAALLLAESESKLSQMLEGSGLKLSNLNTSSEHGKRGNSDQNSNKQNEQQNEKPEPEANELATSIGATKSQDETINLIA